MAWNNVPINGWPQLKGLEKLPEVESVVDDVSALKTTVGNSSSGLVKDVADIKTWIGTVAPTTETAVNPS